MSDRAPAACAEFPNDNPRMHRGAIWYCADVVGAAVCERPELPAAPVVLAVTEPPTDPAPPVIDADDETDDIEIVETLAVDDAVDESPTDDPFATLDVEGVGELIEIACTRGRKTRPDIKLGICGEHGGDPASVFFCHKVGLDYVSCSPYRVPIARLAAAQAALGGPLKTE